MLIDNLLFQSYDCILDMDNLQDLGEMTSRNSTTLRRSHSEGYMKGYYREPFNEFDPGPETKIRPGSGAAAIPAKGYNSIIPIDFTFKDFPKIEDMSVTLVYSAGLPANQSAWCVIHYFF